MYFPLSIFASFILFSFFTRLFDHIVNSINKLLGFSLAVYGDATTVGILDIFGFENNGGDDNSFEQLCINTANEQLQYYFNQYIFKWEREEYITEGVPVDIKPIDSNRPVLDMLLARPCGLFAFLDEESKFPKSTDRSLMTKWENNLSKSRSYQRGSGDRFAIVHYAERVEYNANNFLNKNKNFLSPDLIKLLRESNQPTVQYIFSCPIKATGRLQCDQNPQGAAAQHSQSRFGHSF